MTEYVIETEGLTKYYGRKKVVDSLNLKVPQGSVFAFLGRNGAGKTTTLQMLLGFLKPTRGQSWILGSRSDCLKPKDRARIGYLTEGHQANDWMSVEENGQFQASFYENWNSEIFYEVLSHFNLDLKTKAKHLSRGEKAGLSLALTLAPEPELLVLDDPALGLDPVARRTLLESILFVTKQTQKTVLFSSHQLSDVERVADHIAIVREGVLQAQCSMEIFLQRVKKIVLGFDEEVPQIPKLKGLLNLSKNGQEVSLVLVNAAQEVFNELYELKPKSLEEVSLSLEEAFLHFMGERGEKKTFNQLGVKV